MREQQPDDLDQLMDLARRFCLRRVGQTPRSIAIRLWGGGKFVFPVPAVPIELPAEDAPGRAKEGKG